MKRLFGVLLIVGLALMATSAMALTNEVVNGTFDPSPPGITDPWLNPAPGHTAMQNVFSGTNMAGLISSGLTDEKGMSQICNDMLVFCFLNNFTK